MQAFQGGQIIVVVIAALMAAVGVAYYFRVISAMYFNKAEHGALDIPVKYQCIFLLCTVLLIATGLIPALFPF
jgi:NADH-quinone oxidoreductase subunit N